MAMSEQEAKAKPNRRTRHAGLPREIKEQINKVRQAGYASLWKKKR